MAPTIRANLSDAQIKMFFKKHGIDTRKSPPTREELFALVRDVFYQGSVVDLVQVKWKE